MGNGMGMGNGVSTIRCVCISYLSTLAHPYAYTTLQLAVPTSNLCFGPRSSQALAKSLLRRTLSQVPWSGAASSQLEAPHPGRMKRMDIPFPSYHGGTTPYFHFIGPSEAAWRPSAHSRLFQESFGLNQKTASLKDDFLRLEPGTRFKLGTQTGGLAKPSLLTLLVSMVQAKLGDYTT